VATGVSLHSLPIFLRLAGRPVILLGDGEMAAAKRRLLERAGAVVVAEDGDAQLAIVAIEDETEALATIARLGARGVLVNAVDRPDVCDFTLPAIIDRDPVLVAIGTDGASAGLAAALRQRLETLLPARLGKLALALQAARAELRKRWPDPAERRRMLATAMSVGEPLDPLRSDHQEDIVPDWIVTADTEKHAIQQIVAFRLNSNDPDDLTLRQARALAQADQICHDRRVSAVILDRARADALRIVSAGPPVEAGPGLTVYLEMA
jgi:uroporphyrin-III C-methyltransferase/precorrin-2 dehydrogenase/sirohydrochlorin ferrochelatase